MDTTGIKTLAGLLAELCKGGIDYGNPLDVAVGRSYAAIENALGNPRLPQLLEIEREAPVYDPDSLVMNAWVASSVTESQQAPIVRPGHLSWVNDSFFNLLQEVEVCGSEEAKKQLNDTLSYCFKEERDGPSAMGPRAGPGLLSFGEFLNMLGEEPSDRAILDQFFMALRNAPATVLGKSPIELYDDGDTIFTPDGQIKVLTQTADSIASPASSDMVEIFRVPIRLSGARPLIILGARVQTPSGVKVRRGAAFEPRRLYFDLYAVWQIRQLRQSEKFKPEDFTALQGVLIPVDSRTRIYERMKERARQAQIAALAARNFSHNLGSHAILYIVKGLTENEPDPESYSLKAVADFLAYIQHRASLVL